MKLVSFERDGAVHIGAVVDGTVVDLNAVDSALPTDMVALMELGDAGLDKARAAADKAKGDGRAAVGKFGEVQLLAPVPNPPKYMMGGRNYLKHIDELREREDASIRVPPTPRIFAKFNSSITGHGAPVTYPGLVKQLDFEGEFSVVIGKHARFVSEKEAMDYIAGYTIVNDVSARCIQLTGELIVAKNFEGFGPMGPWIVTKDEVPDPHDLSVKTFINGEQVGEAHTSDMLFNLPQYISFLSKVFPLVPGDVLTTGSPPGPGMFRTPPLFTKVGDIMRIEVENVGALENPVVAEKTPA